MLKPLAQSMETYFKDSFSFKVLTDDLVLPPGAKLFTADAVSMYTNINTNAALTVICAFIEENERNLDITMQPP